MGKSGYPVTADLTAFALSGNVTLDTTQAGNAVLAGIRSVESACHRHFLAGKDIQNNTVAASVRRFAPALNRQGYLNLGGDLSAPPASVVYTATPDATPESWVLDTDYHLEPLNAADLGLPYTGLMLKGRWWWIGFDQAASVAVTGTWGYGATIPEDVWSAMLAAGMLWALNMQIIKGAIRGPLLEWSEAGASARYGSVLGTSSVVDSWRKLVDDTRRQYRRRSV